MNLVRQAWPYLKGFALFFGAQAVAALVIIGFVVIGHLIFG